MPRYIDADAFEVDCRKRYCTGCENYNGIKCKSCWVADMLDETENAPTVSHDEVRGVGEWEALDRVADMAVFRCSACRSIIHCETVLGKSNFAYCPNCGAKMEVSEDA